MVELEFKLVVGFRIADTCRFHNGFQINARTEFAEEIQCYVE